MAQHDFDIANQSAPNFRSDLNDALEALASLSSGGTAPSTTYANMLWYDTANNILKMRSEADDAWISIGYIDQTANAFRILDDTQVTNTSGTQTGLLGDQATGTWETGTATTESLVSPAKVKAAIEALAPQGGITLLGTVTTTSGTSRTLSGLTLTDYKFLRVVAKDVSHSQVIIGNNYFLRIESENFSEDIDSGFFCSGQVDIDLSNGIGSGAFAITSTGISGSFYAQDTGLSTASTSITFDWSTLANFDNGSIKVYGMK